MLPLRALGHFPPLPPQPLSLSTLEGAGLNFATSQLRDPEQALCASLSLDLPICKVGIRCREVVCGKHLFRCLPVLQRKLVASLNVSCEILLIQAVYLGRWCGQIPELVSGQDTGCAHPHVG